MASYWIVLCVPIENSALSNWTPFFDQRVHIRIQLCFNSLVFPVQFSTVAQSCPTLCDPMDCIQHARPLCLSPTPRVYSNSVMPFNHLIFCCHLLLPPSIFPSIKVFSSESVLCIKWPKYWSFSFSISHSNEYSGLISLRTDRRVPSAMWKPHLEPSNYVWSFLHIKYSHQIEDLLISHF